MIRLRILLALVMFSFFLPAFAQEQMDIYSVAVPVENQSESQRQAAFSVALHEVVNTLNANPNIKSNTDLSKLLEHSEVYVESYSYQTDPEQQDALKIIVHFDREALNQFFPQLHATQSQPLNLQISGVTSTQSLNAITDYISQMNAIKSVMISQVMGENVTFSVVLQGNVSVFIQALLTSQRFVSLSAEDSLDQSTLRFKWIGELNV